MILAEKIDQRAELADVLREWIQELAKEASCGEIYVDRTADGWMFLEADDEALVSSIIRLQTRMNPIVSRRPPYPARVLRVGETSIRAECPDLEGKTIHKTFPTSSFAASLGYGGDDPRNFLEAAGFAEGSITSISAGLPSYTQLKLVEEYVVRGLDRLLILNAAPQEVESVMSSWKMGSLIAESQALTLSTHALYVKLGVTLTKAYERIMEAFSAISRKIEVRPLPWRNLAGAKIKLFELEV